MSFDLYLSPSYHIPDKDLLSPSNDSERLLLEDTSSNLNNNELEASIPDAISLSPILPRSPESRSFKLISGRVDREERINKASEEYSRMMIKIDNLKQALKESQRENAVFRRNECFLETKNRDLETIKRLQSKSLDIVRQRNAKLTKEIENLKLSNHLLRSERDGDKNTIWNLKQNIVKRIFNKHVKA